MVSNEKDKLYNLLDLHNFPTDFFLFLISEIILAISAQRTDMFYYHRNFILYLMLIDV